MNIIMAKEIKIAPSLLSANFADLRSDLEKSIEAKLIGCTWILWMVYLFPIYHLASRY